MTRYHVDTKPKLRLLAIAIDQALGLRDAAGNPTPREQMVHKPGHGVQLASKILGAAHDCWDRPDTKTRLVEGADGSAALEIDDAPPITAALGSTVHGHQLPTAASLVQVTRPREHDLLPDGVRDKLDDQYLESMFSGKDADDANALAAVTLELGARANAAHTRMKGKPPWAGKPP